MKASTLLGWGLVLGLAFSLETPVQAQDHAGNRAEAARNRSERAKNKRQRRDDKRDLARIADIARDWNAAVSSQNKKKEQAADVRLAVWLRREIREEKREAKQAHAEKRQARRERDRSRREARKSGTRDDRRDLRDDRRDLKDDRRDAARQTAEAAHIQKLARQLRDMQPAFNKGTATKAQYAKKRKILEALVKGEVRETGQNRREAREDRRERREDRRERKEDRRRR